MRHVISTCRSEGRDSHEWVRELRFSPDGRTLALASHDNSIYMYDRQ